VIQEQIAKEEKTMALADARRVVIKRTRELLKARAELAKTERTSVRAWGIQMGRTGPAVVCAKKEVVRAIENLAIAKEACQE